ncbi:MAG: glutamyl-tRNA reductase [Coriobacteriia bacterium]|nr:glutamyl-tRNA reductase [Coriobacteriia bacterium]
MQLENLMVVGLNVKSSSVEALEQLSIHHSLTTLYLKELTTSAPLQGVVILSTCNRVEFYADASNPALGSAYLRCFLDIQAQASSGQNSVQAPVQTLEQAFQQSPGLALPEGSVYTLTGKDAVRHLYRVVAGLDSLVLGETEILGQVARAYEQARTAGTTNKALNIWFQRALGVGKQMSTLAGLDQYHTSVGRIAVDLAQRELGCINDKRILVLGAGEMSELTIKHLVSKAAPLVMVSNRSLAKAQMLAEEHGVEACSLGELYQQLAHAQLVFSATASKRHLVTLPKLTTLMKERRGSPLVFIDMAVPRDIDPRVASLDCVSYFDIKQLRDVSEQNHSLRQQAAAKVDNLIEEKLREFFAWIISAHERQQVCAT